VASKNDVDRALARALEGFSTWRDVSATNRATTLRHVAETMATRRARSIAVMARDGAKTVAEADAEVSEGVDFARFYAAHAPSKDLSSPLGVVLVVSPWNFPYAIPAGGILASLAAGNAVILKPAPESVAVAAELVGQLWDAGVPRDVLQLIPTRDDECGHHLVTHADVSAVILTGSFETAALFTS
jgi:RHH-type proline utilization regulon transcriptional repressor/proline dehydrogenase/delta 1-pyrroline-5-carboxylate dehydrogenase